MNVEYNMKRCKGTQPTDQAPSFMGEILRSTAGQLLLQATLGWLTCATAGKIDIDAHTAYTVTNYHC